jgi:shikimate dehydrogenase
MKRFAVIGHPIGHSLSPLMHNTAFQLLGLNCQYDAFDIEPDSLNKLVGRFREESWNGFNITTPHKEAIISFIDEVDTEARAFGSVNTVVNHNGIFAGYNTDVGGIQRSIESFRNKIDGLQCLILGAGGVARSVAYVLTRFFHPQSITIAARNPERANAICKDISPSKVMMNVIKFSDQIFDDAVQKSTLIANATTVGMFPKFTETPLPNYQLLNKKHIVFDLVYRPLNTQLLIDAKSAGARTIDGLEMFIQQGAAAFELWTGTQMPLVKIRQVLEAKLSEKTE